MLVEELLLPCPFVYYIFNEYYLCCLVTLKRSNAVFKNTFIVFPCTLYSKRSTQESSSCFPEHRAGHWLFLAPCRAHWPASQALSCHISYGRTEVETILSCLNCPRTIAEHVWWESNTMEHYQNTNDFISFPFSLLPPHVNGYTNTCKGF